ncbi:pq loop repeat protein [Ophiostoma piceae UAMH 11346]|uniref:Pq loop repeat protein n=1 Tax=Ophiostoma piceae (strain UAMH 11346) TaxID=1262450 RepID=S3CUP1_OPHP1|nr:pq loop repeat protein [Ophiostoma piceae UAMH 11346]
MAPQTEIPVIGCQRFGHFGVFRIWTNWRRKNTEGLPGLMMFLWAICGVPFGAYSIIQNFNMPIQVQPQCFMALSLTSWVQILIYGSKMPTWKGVTIGLVTAAIFAGVEAALIIKLRPLYDQGHEGPVMAVGIVASVLLACGIIPPYFEMYKRRGRLAGINFMFLTMDWLGAFFSLMALAVQNTFDVLGGVIYIVCAFLEIGMFVSHGIWLLRSRTLRKEAKAEGKTYDEILAERVAVEGDSYPFAERELPQVLTMAWWAGKFNTLILRRTPTKKSDEEDNSCSESPATVADAAKHPTAGVEKETAV